MSEQTNTVTESVKSGVRLRYLDYLRGVAVLLVLIQHIGERTNEAVKDFSYGKVQLGQLGVTIFFACSGFIIPVSIEKAQSVVKFWIARIFRLYPLYWFALGVLFLAIQLNQMNGDAVPHFANWFWNFTMFQRFRGHQDAIGVAWTLYWEMIFYIAVTILYVLKLNKFPFQVSLAVNTVLIVFTFTRNDFGFLPSYDPAFFSLAVMFHGAVYNAWIQKKVSNAKLVIVIVTTALTGFYMLYLPFAFKGDTSALNNGTGSFPVMLGAYWIAMFIFGLFVILGNKGAKIPLARTIAKIGLISYSVYLMHGFVIAIVDVENKVLAIILWTSITFVVSVVTYLLVEKPSIKIGRSFTKLIDNKFSFLNRV